jgi:hypothetical protein
MPPAAIAAALMTASHLMSQALHSHNQNLPISGSKYPTSLGVSTSRVFFASVPPAAHVAHVTKGFRKKAEE